MKNNNDFTIKNILLDLLNNNNLFANEYDFQFELGYNLRNQGFNVRIEQPIYSDEYSKSKNRCDIIATKNNKTICIELKYVYKENKRNCTSVRARRSFVKDVERLKSLDNKKYHKKYCIFVTNKEVVYNSEKSTAESEELKKFKKNYSDSFEHTTWQNGNGVHYLITKC